MSFGIEFSALVYEISRAGTLKEFLEDDFEKLLDKMDARLGMGL